MCLGMRSAPGEISKTHLQIVFHQTEWRCAKRMHMPKIMFKMGNLTLDLKFVHGEFIGFTEWLDGIRCEFAAPVIILTVPILRKAGNAHERDRINV